MFPGYDGIDEDLAQAVQELKNLGRAWNIASIPLKPKDEDIAFIVIPGLGAADRTTTKTRKFLEKFHYQTFPSSLSGVLEFTPECLRELEQNVADVAAQLSARSHLFLVGHSAGAIAAIGAAKKHTEKLSGVFSLGGVFRTDLIDVSEDVSRAINYLKETMSPDDLRHYFDSLSDPSPVPTVSVYTNADHFLPAEVTRSADPEVKNIKIERSNKAYLGGPANIGPSHIGLIYNIDAMRVVVSEANRIVSEKGLHYRAA